MLIKVMIFVSIFCKNDTIKICEGSILNNTTGQVSNFKGYYVEKRKWFRIKHTLLSEEKKEVKGYSIVYLKGCQSR